MFALIRKEIGSFFAGITGYVVIIVFLAINAMFLWIFKGEFNILESGFANLDSFFVFAPIVFLLLVPAVTMRMFAEEMRSGTIELLLTRPISDIRIILAKYFAGILLVILSLLPTLIYYYSINELAFPVGNVDSGAFWGSWIGLFFLASVYVSIGIFASSLTSNQIISFLISVIGCFVFYLGFDYLAEFFDHQTLKMIVYKMGINEHYYSLGRGLLDSRDVIYFVSVIAIFIFLTRMVLEKRKW